MPRKKSVGIKKIGDRNYAIDAVIIINERRVHIRSTGYQSAQEASDALPKLIEAKRRKAFLSDSGIKDFDDLLEHYYDWRLLKSKPQSVDSARYALKTHALPYFQGKPVHEALSPEGVRRWYRAKATDPKVSQERKNKVFSEMRMVIERAWRWKCIDSDSYQDDMDIVRNVPVEKRAKKERGVWTIEQEERFLASIPKDSIDYPMFSLFLYLGCRLSEFIGLQWKCFSEEKRAIAICQQVIYCNGEARLTPELKTNESYRINSLDEENLSLLLRYRATLNSSRDEEFIFPSAYSASKPMSKSVFRRRFDHWIQESGLPKIVVHGVRHSKATMLASVCQNAEEVAVGAKFLGHSSSMFMDTYVAQDGIAQDDLIRRLKKR